MTSFEVVREPGHTHCLCPGSLNTIKGSTCHVTIFRRDFPFKNFLVVMRL